MHSYSWGTCHGQILVCADHPSNEFFRSFPNCLTYRTSKDFVAKVKEALENEPYPLTPEQRYQLSWEAATQRFMEYSELDRILNKENNGEKASVDKGKLIAKSASMPNLTELVDGGLAFPHYCLIGNQFQRLCIGAIPGTRDYDNQHCKDLHLLPWLVWLFEGKLVTPDYKLIHSHQSLCGLSLILGLKHATVFQFIMFWFGITIDDNSQSNTEIINSN